MTPPVALYDASVLYPSLIRSLLMHLAPRGLVAARWSQAIHDEWTRNLLLDLPDLTAAQVERTRDLVDQASPDAITEVDERLTVRLSLPDPGDQHVLAAAVSAQRRSRQGGPLPAPRLLLNRRFLGPPRSHLLSQFVYKSR